MSLCCYEREALEIRTFYQTQNLNSFNFLRLYRFITEISRTESLHPSFSFYGERVIKYHTDSFLAAINS
jgi:hypothetical protein